MLEKYALYKIVKVLTNNPTKKVTLKSIAKDAEVSVSTSKRCLDFLKDKNIVIREEIGNSHQFWLNNESPVVKQIKVLNTTSKLVYSGFLNELIEKFSPVSVVLYGSCATGENDEKSDIDLLIISSKKSKKHIETVLSNEYNYQVYTMSEWRQKAKENKAFYENVIINSICLYGNKPVVL